MKGRGFITLTLFCAAAFTIFVLNGCTPSEPTEKPYLPPDVFDSSEDMTAPASEPALTSDTAEITTSDTAEITTSDTATTTDSASAFDTAPTSDLTTASDITTASDPATSAAATVTAPALTTTPQSALIITDASVPTTRDLPAASPPTVTLPRASGINVKTGDKSTIDYSHVSDGYVMIKYTGNRERLIIRIYSPAGTMYQYAPAVNNEFNTFPLNEGNGKYSVEIYEGAAGTTQVAVVDKHEFDAVMTNSLSPFLMPTFYIDYTADSAVVTKASELCSGKSGELEKVTAVYNWVVENISYDDDTADAVRDGRITTYRPNLANFMRDKKGICFDYSAGIAAMLRSQGIATRMEHGYAGTIYHAWISVYTRDAGTVNLWIKFDGNRWTMMEPTFAAQRGDNNSAFRDFVNNRSNYQTLYYF